MKDLKNTYKTKKSKPRKKKYIQNRLAPNLLQKSITMASPYKRILPDTPFYPNDRSGGYMSTIRSNVAQDGHHDRHVN